ncbi:MAG TPA: phosphoglycolate phosphatase [Burkholderiaceae bacterium]|nr:phosphoglycolate phosphatase [Burkholderiaceae bacterium]
MSAHPTPTIRGLLFDLDGTLIDSAPDLAGAANRLRADHGLEPLPLDQLRPMVGSGARGMVGVAFGVAPGEARFEALRDAFLAHYEAGLLERTQPFDGVPELLSALDAAGIAWGIVTNKATRFTAPIVAGLGLAQRAGVVVCGDTTPHAKPHPEPLLHAARALGLAPGSVAYVGDDLRDAQAARAAGMPMLAATWGYLGLGEPVHDWGADALLDAPSQLLEWLRGRAR